MGDWRDVVGGVAAVMAVATWVPYCRAMVRGTVRPHAMSWLVWGALTGTGFAVALAEGGGAGAWTMGVSAAVCVFTAAWAFVHGDRRFPAFDWACMAGVAVAVVVWALTDDALATVVAITVIDCLASAPTVRKSWVDPSSETVPLYAWSAVKAVVGIAALEVLAVTTVLYPAALVVINLTVVAVLVRGRRTGAQLADEAQQTAGAAAGHSGGEVQA